jgi:hypothetical protein
MTTQNFPGQLSIQLERLRAAGWTRAQVAAETGFTSRQISNWQNGAACRYALQVVIILVLANLKKPPAK